MTGSYIDPSNISIDFVSSQTFNEVEFLELDLNLIAGFPWTKKSTVNNENQLSKPLSIDAFAKCLFKGEMMAFLPNI